MPNIIVLDDDPTNAGLTKMLLELDGFSVTSCADIQQALAASQSKTDAFVLDINLARGTSGLDLLKQIRAGKTEATADTIVIMTSGDYRREEESLSLGASSFLLKPYSPERLSSTLKKMLS